MFDCNNLVHPFQNDPGFSQSQRVLDDLLAGTTKIDGRTLADLLNYFTELSPHIKYYYWETKTSVLKEDDWQNFFNKSLPFILAGATKINADILKEKFEMYSGMFSKNPSAQGLQLLLHFFYYSTIFKINKLYDSVKDSGLPLVATLEQIIKNKLKGLVTDFIKTSYTAYNLFDIRNIDFSLLLIPGSIWQIDNPNDLIYGDARIKNILGMQQQLVALQNQVNEAFLSMPDAISIISGAAVTSLQQSLLPLKDDLKQKHTPHLALVFTFLDLFTRLQDDLNRYTKKHLDFFYQDVLQLKPKEAQPDSVYLILELQKQLKQYALKKGLLAKADKDKNNVEIDFALDDDIVVNKTQVADLRTLFINNQNAGDYTYAEGVYMATKANTADGVDIDFTDDPKNYPTLGAKFSKYTAPGTTSPKLYPAARLGFVLASPVLLLNEGKRTIIITLTCSIGDNCGKIKNSLAVSSDPCCSEKEILLADNEDFPPFINAVRLLPDVQILLSDTYVYITPELIAAAQKQGLSENHAIHIHETYLQKKISAQVDDCPKPVCCSSLPIELDEAITNWSDWKAFVQQKSITTALSYFTTDEQRLLFQIFTPFKPLKVLLSGEKDWIDPLDDFIEENVIADGSTIPVETDSLAIESTGDSASFIIKITAIVAADKPAITFYSKENLKEDLGTNQPVVKVELNDTNKPALNPAMYGNPSDPLCCLQNKDVLCDKFISLYHFFREVVVTDSKIDVSVCGLKNFIVQNDENVQDVNSPVYPFGTRPAIIDFDVVNHRKDDPVDNGKTKNLIGPSFYVGSGEIFSKKWGRVCVKLNWKDKPGDFNEYYKAYLLRLNYHDCSEQPKTIDVYGLNECDFEVNLSVLDKGKWQKEIDPAQAPNENNTKSDFNRKLFINEDCGNNCNDDSFSYSFYIQSTEFNIENKFDNLAPFKKFDATSKKGFLKFTLEKQDFLHKDYAFVLSRQMMALGRFPDVILESAVYAGKGDMVIVYQNIGNTIIDFQNLIQTTNDDAKKMDDNAKKLSEDYEKANNDSDTPKIKNAKSTEGDDLSQDVEKNTGFSSQTLEDASALKNNLDELNAVLNVFEKGDAKTDLTVLIPKEPWTPIISNMALDYTATAERTDITLIHLFPYKDTYKQEQITLAPALFPSLCDEGTLFIGLTDLVPGSNVNMLFQLAEATSDSESDTQPVYWNYLYNNQWFSLRNGYEILDDATENLTTSGVIKFALPENMSADNTVMPKGMYWIKAAVPANSQSVCDTFNIYTQAIKSTFVIDENNDTSRLSQPLEAGSVSKLKIADANVKQVTQPAPSFDGQEPEVTKHYYVRVSELLRHKGRAIQKFDYERLTLEAFPQVFKAKCINHSFKLDADKYHDDFPYAPGYVLIAVIPDLNKLLAGQSFEPKLPTGVIEKIEAYLTSRSSPFIKIKAVNPRYEKISFCLSVVLNNGFDENFYKNQLAQDLREFLAPWAVGNYDKLTFGQCINKSDVVQFLETREYVDYITKMQMQNDFYGESPSEDLIEVCPHTPRSILLAGEIHVCIEEGKTVDLEPTDCADYLQPFLDYCKPVNTIQV